MAKKTFIRLSVFLILSCLLISSAYADSTTLHTTVPDKYWTVSYDANGGRNAPEPQYKLPDKELIITAKEPVRDGFEFMGWADKNSAAKPDYRPGDSYKKDKNLLLFALWQKENLFGDVNEDGKVDKDDYILIMQYLAGMDVKINVKYADINKDGVLSAADYIALLQYINK